MLASPLRLSSSEEETLLAQNAALKAELARLQALAEELSIQESHADPSQVARVQDAEVMREAFDTYDTDKSGFLERDEFVILTAQLGAILDDEEIDEAFAAIDLSGDGKISFNEFVQWWTQEDLQIKPKTGIKLNALRARVVGKFASHSMPTLLRRLSEHDADAAESDWVNHHMHFSVGDATDDPGAYLRASFQVIPEDQVDPAHVREGCGAMPIVTLAGKDGQSESEIAAARTELEEALAAATAGGMPVQFEVAVAGDGGRDTSISVIGPSPDPLEMAKSLHLNLNDFIRKVQFSIELLRSPSALVDVNDESSDTLASIAQFRVQADVQFRKALIYSLMVLPHMDKAWIGAWLENTAYTLDFGDPVKFIESMKTPEGYDAVAALERDQQQHIIQMQAMGMDPMLIEAIQQQQQQQLMQLRIQQDIAFLRPEFYLQTGFQNDLNQTFQNMVRAHTAGLPPAVSDLFNCLRENFASVSQFKIVSPSGMVIQIDMKKLIEFHVFPEFEVPDTDEN